MFLKNFPDTFIALIHDSVKLSPIITRTTLKASDIPAGYGAFFTVNGFKGERKKTNLTCISGVFADIDQKQGKSSLQDIQQMVFMDLPPTYINETKNGWHLIWKLTEPITDITPELIKTVEGINRRFVDLYKADNAATDVGHLLRIPGTEHRKNPAEPFVIKTVYTGADTYTLEDLCAVYEPVIKEDAVVEYGKLTDSSQERITRMLEKPHIATLWNGKVEEDKLSESDLALCNHLAFWLAKDPVAMEQAWLSSPLGQRGKTQSRADYRKLAIDKAIAATKDVYKLPKAIKDIKDMPEREAYLAHLDLGKWDDKDWVRGLKSIGDRYFINFYQRVALLHPHLKYEIGRLDSFWEYNETEGIYEPVAQSTFAGMIIRALRLDQMDGYTTDSQVRRIILNFTADVSRGVTLDSFSLPSGWLHVKNGWLHLTTKELVPHTPERLSISKMDTDYISGATCPLYDTFLDVDVQMPKDQVRVLDQFSGYLLTDGIEQHSCLILEGRKGCGKSTLVEIWMSILGKKAIPMQLTALQNGSERFIGQTLAYKNLCWFDEANPRTTSINEFFQNLITGEKIRVERKGVQGDDFVNNTLKIILSLNEMPDHMPTGMDRRYRHIVFTRSFYEEGVVDPDYKSRLLESEKSGVLNRMIRGLDDLRKMSKMTIIGGEEERKREYTLTSDDFSSFLSDHFVPVSDGGTVRYTYEEMRNAFVAEYPKGYNKQLAVRGFNKKLFTTRLSEFKNIDTGKTNGSRGYTGLKLKEGHSFSVNEYEKIKTPEYVDF